MHLRLITAILLMSLLVIFIGLNLGNVSDISFGVYTLQDIPVFLTILASFVLGLLASLPVVLTRRFRPPKIDQEGRSNRTKGRTASRASEKNASGRSGALGRRSRASDLEDGSYGVD